MPLSSTPERGKLPTDGSRIVTETGTQVAEVLLDWRGVLNAGRLGQDTNGPVVVLVSSRRRPRVVHRVRRDSRFSFADEAIHHGLADE